MSEAIIIRAGNVTKGYVDTSLALKADKVEGKGLSTNDYDDTAKEAVESLGTASKCDTGIKEGNVPIINSDGKLDASILPSISITDVFTVNSESAMHALDVQKGDICIRTDENKTYVLADTSKWVELLSPTGQVSSVNGKKGNVVITAKDVDTYTKAEIDGKVPVVVQEKGISATSVMSQNAVTNELGLKVDKIEGKGLSTEDFTTEEKTKLEKAVVNAATGNNSIAIGEHSSSPNDCSIALGTSSSALGDGAIAIGLLSKAANNDSISIGEQAESKGLCDVTIGREAKSNDEDRDSRYNDSSVVIGHCSETTYSGGTAIGGGAVAKGKHSAALGYNSLAEEDAVLSIGSGDIATPATRRIVNVTDPVNLQDAATKNYVDTRINPTILYSNDSGTKENFTLSQPYTDFSRIGVYAQSQWDIDSVYNEMHTSTTNYMTLAYTTFQNKDNYGMLVWRLAHIIFKGNKVEFDINGAASFPNGDNKYAGGPNIPQSDGSNDGLKITRVVGYK